MHRIFFRGSLIFSRKVPFWWFDVPENLRIKTQPNLISINQEFTEPTKSQKITKYVGNIVLIAIIVKLVNDVLQYEKSEQDYGDLISKLTNVASIEDPLKETVGDFWSQS